MASSIVGLALSGAHEMHSTTCSCSLNSALHSFVATTHTRTVWSFEQLAISDPSWLGRTIRTHSLWPVNVFTQYLTNKWMIIGLGTDKKMKHTHVYSHGHYCWHGLIFFFQKMKYLSHIFITFTQFYYTYVNVIYVY